MNADAPHFVYVAFDAKWNCLYVGCTNNVERRMKEHQGYGWGWTNRVAHLSVLEFPTQKEALEAETNRIQKLRPLVNIRRNPRRMSFAVAVANHEWLLEFDRMNGLDPDEDVAA